jgi:hypothetical protein
MSRIVFLLEEPSMKVLLEGMLPRLFPDLEFQCIKHDGKTDLQKSIPKKLKAWREPGVKFVVIQDNDGNDCKLIKKKLFDLCVEGGRTDILIRIVCQELESWYFGDPVAMSEAFDNPTLAKIAAGERYRDPDAIAKPSKEILCLVPEFQKVSGARLMAERLSRQGNRSRSFSCFVEGLEREAGLHCL